MTAHHADALLTEVNDFLASLETVLHTATIDERRRHLSPKEGTATLLGNR